MNMYDVGRKLYLPGLGPSIGMPNIFSKTAPNMVFSTVFVHRETSGHLIRRGQDQSIFLIKNVEKVKRRVARRSEVPKDRPCRVGWCNCAKYARTTLLFIRRGNRKRGPCLKSLLRLTLVLGNTEHYNFNKILKNLNTKTGGSALRAVFSS